MSYGRTPAEHIRSAEAIREKERELRKLERLKLHYQVRFDAENAAAAQAQIEALAAEITADREARWPSG